MLFGCSSLIKINISSFNTDNIDDISDIFDTIPNFCTLICNDQKFIEKFNIYKNS